MKSGRRVRSLPGLAACEKRFPLARTFLVTGTGDAGRGVFGNQIVVPINGFLAAPASHWLDHALARPPQPAAERRRVRHPRPTEDPAHTTAVEQRQVVAPYGCLRFGSFIRRNSP